MDLINNKYECCGCTACANICSRNAITMCEDNEGFKYPQIDSSLCVNCGLCRKVCPLKGKKKPDTNHIPIVYSAKNKDFSIRMQSTSGGIFSVLCKKIIEKGGAVYGAVFDDGMNVIHARASTLEVCKKFRGSKYVQSDLSNTYRQIENDLQHGLFVLFSGTPCQCDGLKSYLNAKKVDFKKIILCDLVCHGVPSPKVWKDYINYIKQKGEIIDYKFRDKELGWHGANISVNYADGVVERNTLRVKSYSTLYFGQYITRPSCEKCLYANFDRCSDITIGDFWGIEKVKPEFDDNNGVSLILLNTEKGKNFFKEIRDDIEYFDSSTSECMQEQLQKPPKAIKQRKAFWEYYENHSYFFVARKFARCGFYGHCRHLLGQLLKKVKKHVKI